MWLLSINLYKNKRKLGRKLLMVQIHPKTRIGHVEFKVLNLERQIAFYENVVGLEVIKQEGNKAYLEKVERTRYLFLKS